MKFQHIYLSVLLLLFFAAYPVKSLKAQSEFGLKGGALYSTLKSENLNSLFDLQNSSGFSLGAFYQKQNLLGKIGFQTELLYQMKGANIFIQHPDLTIPGYGENNPGYGFSYYQNGSYIHTLEPVLWDRHQERYHYFSLPILLTFPITKFLDIYSGFEVGYMFANSIVYSSDNNLSILGDVNKFSASWIVGVKVRLGDNTKLDFRYLSNLIPLYEMYNSNIKDRTFSISIEQSLWRK